MSVTQEQIAVELGLSRMAVSYALRGSVKIPPATRDRVVAMAKTLGYRVNAAARSARTGRQQAVAVLLSADAVARSMVPGNTMRGLDDRLGEAGYHLTLAHLPDRELIESCVPKLLREYVADALIVAYAEAMPAGLPDRLDASRQPAVWLNVKRDHDAVYPDDFGAARDATLHLVAAGHRSIAYYDPSHAPDTSSLHYSVHDRRAGYRAAMAEAGLEPHEWTEGCIPSVDRARALAANLARPNRPTALVSYGETNAAFFAAASLSLGVPDDLSVVTFGLAPPVGPGVQVDTWVIPQTALGRAAGDMVLHRINNPGEAIASRVIPFRYEPGSSVLPIARGAISPEEAVQ